MATDMRAVRARGPLPPHGQRARYIRECRCPECTKANTLYMREYREHYRHVAHAQWSEPPLPAC
jgi:hypothetical protein